MSPPRRKKTFNNFLINNKAQKIKKKFVHKVKTKKGFYKTLSKEKHELETPSFYKQIFDEKSADINEDYTNQERQISDSEDNLDEDDHHEELIKRDKGSSEESKKSGKIKSNHRPKPNPFYKLLKERDHFQHKKQAKIEAIKQEKEMRIQKQKAYLTHRKITKKKFLKRNSKGQPLMKTRIDHLLSKITN
ncbi:4772_t:CDS:2 [Dentiscutata erythropus]|uniref:rRNA-processing protein FYV7 n=1 Tax=Dentiscutata erythropus TaxID=1348616 RepID=A0A9N9P7R7_9GLOM|nr:4772_t:CDS:2 [Dentiscutata erythropus]